ncbi:peptidylprolyl isomerase fpr4 [Borealophlyctis nickersoniae]|nr:peptidylprolyl isomerase fpr4 [Borealophlyctis nickersoniae]
MITGFWALSVDHGKSYSQIVDQTFRITHACLDADAPTTGERVTISVTFKGREFVLCTLIPGRIEQTRLDIAFVEGEEITISSSGGDYTVDLTGNTFIDYPLDAEEDISDNEEMFDEEGNPIDMSDDDDENEWESDEMDEDEEGDEDDEDEDEDELAAENEMIEELNAMIGRKRKLPEIPKESKKVKSKIVELEETTETPVNGKATKKEKKQQKKEAVKDEEASPAKKEPVSAKAVAKQEKKETPAKEAPKPKKKTLPNGLIIEDIETGTGTKAKNGKKVMVRYIGRLTNGKVFDSNTKGKPFDFKLGAGQVIRGWDLGVQGMNVGGTRKLTIPPSLAYGAAGAPPDIPRNATLEFEVKLLDVKGK